MHDTLIKILEMSFNKRDPIIWNSWKRSIDFGDSAIELEGFSFQKFSLSTVSKFDFSNTSFKNCEFINVSFHQCNFERSSFFQCKFIDAGTRLIFCHFRDCKFEECHFEDITLSGSVFNYSRFLKCNVIKSSLVEASLVGCRFIESLVDDCNISGASIWDITVEDTTQSNLKINYGKGKSQELIFQDLALANALYIFASNNKNFAGFLDKKSTNFVLILGRFGANLDNLNMIAEALRSRQFSPIIFDFEVEDLTLIETIKFLALLSKFIIVDISNPKSVPSELEAIISTVIIPIVPIVISEYNPFGTFSAYSNLPNVLKPILFDTVQQIVDQIDELIIKRANERYDAIYLTKNQSSGFIDIRMKKN